MNPVTFLRIASVITFVQAVLHTIGSIFGTAAPGAQELAVLAMKTNQFQVMGLTRSYWDFHLGTNLAISVTLLVESVVFWQLSSLGKSVGAPLRPLLATYLVGYLGLAVISYRYFFAPPVIGEILIASCLGLAILQSRPVASTEPRPALT